MKKKGSRNFFYIEVDADLVIRNIIFFVIFFMAISASINYFLWPTIEAYKMQFLEEKKFRVIFLQIQKDFNANLASLKKMKTTYQKSLDVMAYKLGSTKLQADLSRYFSDLKVTKKSSQKDSQNQYIIDEYSVSGKVNDLKNVQKFFSEIENSPMSIEILLPVVIKKSSDSDDLIFDFYLDIKRSIYTPPLKL